MSVQITSIDRLQSYMRGVDARAEHHAGNVRNVILAIAGALVLFKDKSKPIEVHVWGGKVKNALWVYINGDRYLLSYDHTGGGGVQVKEGSKRGRVIKRFDDQTPIADITNFFANL
ncbi:MAG: hypothetical protein ACLQAT_14685 [Candidatus Binataceae bacterium]